APKTETPSQPKEQPSSPSSSEKTLRPDAVIPVGGTVGALLLTPDRKRLFYLDVTNHVVGRVDTKTLKRDEPLEVLDGTQTLAMSRDGKLLVAPAAGPKGKGRTGHLQLIDAVAFTRQRDVALSLRPYDVAVGDREVYVSDADNDWTQVVAVSLARG